MKKILPLFSVLLLSATIPAIAQEVSSTQMMPVMSLEMMTEQEAVAPLDQDITTLQKEWARIKYQISDKDKQLNAIHKLEDDAAAISAKYPNNAEPKIWQGIILSTDAGIVKGLSALGKVEKAKELFEISIKMNPNALDGSAYTSLGSLYYQVPGWPVGFGDDKEAEKNLQKAVSINPTGIDPNFFYGDFLFQDGRYEEAKTYLNRALQAPERPGRALADAGRKQEVKATLAQVDQKLNDKAKKKYN